MKTKLLFDFQVDRKSSTITMQREFLASVEMVWKAWTTPEIIEKWMAPKPMVVQTKAMDFREGGFWHFALASPQGKKYWCRYDYEEIESLKLITELRAYSDENGLVPTDFLRTKCVNLFKQAGEKTLVTMNAKYASSEVFQMMSSQAHMQGFSSTLVNLDRLLIDLVKDMK